jgi:hypothetical protein
MHSENKVDTNIINLVTILKQKWEKINNWRILRYEMEKSINL